MKLFALDIESFAIAGGLVMFILGIEMILSVRIFKENPDEATTESIVPLAFPIITGAETTLLSLKAAYSTYNILIDIGFNLLFVYLVLRSSGWFERKLSSGGFNILRKIFGIILLAITIKFIITNLFKI